MGTERLPRPGSRGQDVRGWKGDSRHLQKNDRSLVGRSFFHQRGGGSRTGASAERQRGRAAMDGRGSEHPGLEAEDRMSEAGRSTPPTSKKKNLPKGRFFFFGGSRTTQRETRSVAGVRAAACRRSRGHPPTDAADVRAGGEHRPVCGSEGARRTRATEGRLPPPPSDILNYIEIQPFLSPISLLRR